MLHCGNFDVQCVNKLPFSGSNLDFFVVCTNFRSLVLLDPETLVLFHITVMCHG